MKIVIEARDNNKTRPDTQHKSFAVFVSACQNKEVTDGPMDGPTDQRTDGPTHPLIIWLTGSYFFLIHINKASRQFQQKNDTCYPHDDTITQLRSIPS